MNDVHLVELSAAGAYDNQDPTMVALIENASCVQLTIQYHATSFQGCADARHAPCRSQPSATAPHPFLVPMEPSDHPAHQLHDHEHRLHEHYDERPCPMRDAHGHEEPLLNEVVLTRVAASVLG